VKVTDWPNTDGFEDETTAVLVVARITVCPPAKEALPLLKLPSVLV
jgi:hypothetical protein